ncbi:Oidioi.mRNA.OKI2018_I69.PAR.g12329.t1.cds [Oikopleura dioica]|uniref:Oidioi.mRNA.OKI2018_I69.PAR.g12329.t1.cds n=1 Tax=Oikopleura dioica TaxID=34765 RepID=A0ABN7S768_OIKDI|nr:Oidioi.mRNA.OKI2018_I69.PAR.g12329.t1.cds [Oikopleura dioica]
MLGQGATGGVYRGWRIDTGASVAVKTFNTVGLQRPSHVHNREFDILRAISHPNIVQMFAVEEEERSKESVIVMELCTGGSLYNVLEEPEYIYGLREEHLLKLISDVTNGMSYLREKEIIHRDIKPGNILRSDRSASACWKLTDFGAARQLNQDAQFMSLYGTEEYLHPDMYQRAVLQNRQASGWDATVDLWSLAVTFYHAATGQLPFRPFNGPRKNPQTMGRMTKERPAGAIMAVQQHSPTGEIQWGHDLPKTCRLVGRFRKSVSQLIASLMDGCSFDDYFVQAESIQGMKQVYVFECATSKLLPVYIQLPATISQLKEATKSELPKDKSKEKLDFFIWRGQLLGMSSMIPEESRLDEPIISLGLIEKGPLHLPHTAKPPSISSYQSVDQDTQLARLCCGTLFDIARTVEYLTQIESAADFAAIQVDRVRDHALVQLKALQESLHQNLNSSSQIVDTLSGLNISTASVRRLTGEVRKLREEASTVSKQYQQLEEDKLKLKRNFLSLPEGVHVRICQVADQASEIYTDMKRRRSARTSSPAELACHKAQRLRLKKFCAELVSIFAEKTFPLMKKRHQSTTSYFHLILKQLRLIEMIKQSTLQLKKDCHSLHDLNKAAKSESREAFLKNSKASNSDLNETSLGPLTNLDAENLTNLLQNELPTIYQGIQRNDNLINVIKNLLVQENGKLDLNQAILNIAPNY